MALHSASKMDPDAREDVSIRLYWSTRKKAWDIVVSARQGRVSRSVTKTADTRIDVDVAGMWKLAEAVQSEMESWLF